MTKRVSTKTNFLLQILYQILILGIPLILSPYLTRTLQSEALGEYYYCYSIVTYFSLFIMLGIQSHGCRVIAACKSQEEERKTFYSLFLIHVIAAVIVIFLFIGFIFIFGRNHLLIYLLLIFYLISCLFDITWYYYGKENFKSVILKNTLIKVIEIILIFTLVKKESDLWIYTLIVSASLALGQFILLPPVLRRLKFYLPSFSDIKKHLKPLIILAISVVAINVYCILDKTFIGIFIDDNKASVAFYEYSEKLVKLPVTILGSLGIVLLPKMSYLFEQKDYNEIKSALHKSTVILSCLAVGACFGVASICKIFAPIYYGEDFAICGEYMLYLCPIIIIIPFGATVRNSYLIPSGKDKHYLFSLVTAAILNLILNISLIPCLGVVGAIIGTIASELVACILQFFFVRKELPIGRYLIELIPFLFFGALMYGELFLINYYITSSYYVLLIDIFVGFSTYIVLSAIYLYFTHRALFLEVRNYIFKIFKKRKENLKNEDSSSSTNEIEQ